MFAQFIPLNGYPGRMQTVKVRQGSCSSQKGKAYHGTHRHGGHGCHGQAEPKNCDELVTSFPPVWADFNPSNYVKSVKSRKLIWFTCPSWLLEAQIPETLTIPVIVHLRLQWLLLITSGSKDARKILCPGIVIH